MARARSAGPALITSAESEFAQIIEWYEYKLETTAPPTDLEWEPVKIGPTWQWDGGWLLPECTLGWRVLAWCGRWLRDKKGREWQFTLEQARFILWYFAVDAEGDFIHRNAVLQRLKGWGKDPLAACLALAACFAEVNFDHWHHGRPVGAQEPNAWVQIVAVSEKQTKNTMQLFPVLLPPETRNRYGIGQPGKFHVFGLGDTRQIEAVTSNPDSIEGGRPTLVIRNETQNWRESNRGHDMAGALAGNAAKSERGAARMLDICNAYRPGEDSVGERRREAYDATQGEDPTAMDFGLLYDSLEAPPEAPLTAEDAPAVVRAIAGDSTWLDTRRNGSIVQYILNPENPPSESRRKWYNQIVATADAWTTPQLWDRLADPSVLPPEGAEVFLFLDGSKSDDATALIGCRLDTGDVFVVGIWERPANWDSKRAWLVDRADVDGRVRWACARWDVYGLWCDPSDARDDESGELYWEPLCDDWTEIQDWRLPAVKSGDRQHPIIWDMRSPRHAALHTQHAERTVTDIKDGAFRYDGNKRLRTHVHNARRRPGKYGVGLGKSGRGSSRKVDAAVAMVGARLMRKTWLLANPDGPNEAFFL
ncbi:terminase [Nocardia amamiensis]|uniref:Terminase n=1 Tax=Nocardia amamiensis TaxID=404578 RepID=A0ABS0CX54_9NOCA|nr:terminase [Nocardia amamiensis]MBF6301178.1 terminase [Nocardia amamiensis]